MHNFSFITQQEAKTRAEMSENAAIQACLNDLKRLIEQEFTGNNKMNVTANKLVVANAPRLNEVLRHFGWILRSYTQYNETTVYLEPL